MTKNTNKNFADRLRQGETLIGTLMALDSADVAEILALSGYDWLFLDTEHGAYDPARTKSMLQAASPTPCLIRIPCAEEIWVKKALDIGAAGIIVPQVNTADDVRAVMQWSKYTPQGNRGIGIGRAHDYGLNTSAYIQNANRDTLVVIQAETRQSIENIDEITSVDGIDAILVGPNDLSASLGKPGKLSDDVVTDAIGKVRDSCQARNIPLGIFGVTADSVKPYMEQGFTLITVGVDTLFIIKSATETLQALRADT